MSNMSKLNQTEPYWMVQYKLKKDQLTELK